MARTVDVTLSHQLRFHGSLQRGSRSRAGYLVRPRPQRPSCCPPVVVVESAKYRERHDLAAGFSAIEESRLARDALPEPLVRPPVIEMACPLVEAQAAGDGRPSSWTARRSTAGRISLRSGRCCTRWSPAEEPACRADCRDRKTGVAEGNRLPAAGPSRGHVPPVQTDPRRQSLCEGVRGTEARSDGGVHRAEQDVGAWEGAVLRGRRVTVGDFDTGSGSVAEPCNNAPRMLNGSPPSRHSPPMPARIP